ncbi:MAG: GTP-binding protein [Elainellaceae cyanobacterium]
MLIVVAGPCGAGKTTWICQELAQTSAPVGYIALGAGAVPIDATRVAAQFPQAEILQDQSGAELLQRLAAGVPVYLELGSQLETDIPFLEALPHRRIALVGGNNQDASWQQWANGADEVVQGSPSTVALQSAQLWRAPLSGQVFDPPSLDTFWQELTQGAYGEVHRAKGIFELADGHAFHFDFVGGLPESAYTNLNLPPWLQGRPQRFSGLEVVGQNLDEEAIAATIKACYLSDSLLASHQASLQASQPLEVA